MEKRGHKNRLIHISEEERRGHTPQDTVALSTHRLSISAKQRHMFFFYAFPQCPPVNLNKYQLTVYNHMDACHNVL